MGRCSQLYLCIEFKPVLERSAYLHLLYNVKYGHILARFRRSSHKLSKEIGRQQHW